MTYIIPSVTKPGQITAAIYCRISRAGDDDTTKVDDQERLCRITAEALGWKVGDGCGYPLPNGVYQDNKRSAWKHDRKRPAWDQMLADIEAGKVSAIVVYHGDRLTRQPIDLEILIALSRTRGIKLASPTGVRDLNDDNDQFTLGIEANVYRKESASTSRRRRQQYDRWRREGRVRPGGPGGRSFGFDSDNLTPRPGEFDLIREAAGRILAGETPYSVCRDWNDRGLTATTGKPWRTGNLGPMLALPRYAGLMPDGESKAAWPAALDRGTWERLRAVLDGRAAAFPGHTSARRWLLSGIALCGACRSPLTARWARRNVARNMEAAAVYACVKPGCRKVARSAAHLDAYVSARVVARLADEGNPAARFPAADHAAEWKALTSERAETEGQVERYEGNAGRLRLLMRRLDRIDERMAELRDAEAGDGRARLLARYAGIGREEWEALPLDVRRALTAAAVSVTVLPASGRGPGFRPQDVRVERA